MGRWGNRLTVKSATTALFVTFLFLLFLETFNSSPPAPISSYENREPAPPNAIKHEEHPQEPDAPDQSLKETVSASTNVLVAETEVSVAGRPQFHVVVAHFSEEPYWMSKWIAGVRAVPYAQGLGVHVVIYTKNPDTDLKSLKAVSGADEVVRLPNAGREGGTYLHHILENYDNLPQYMWFSQSILKKAQQVKTEHPAELVDWLDQRLRTKFDDHTGYMSLDRKHDLCYCGHCTDMGRDDWYPFWPQIYSMLQGKICRSDEAQVVSFNGHFIVSRNRVLARPRSTYEYLQKLVDAPKEHLIHTEAQPKWFDHDKGKSEPSNPKFGHTLERLWSTVFNCSDPTVVVDCDLKGMKAEGPGGCSCNDHGD